MSSLDFTALNPQAKNQLALTLASFLLHDSKTPVNADNLNKVLKSAHLDVPALWTNAFVHTLEVAPLDKLLSCGGSSNASAPVQAKEEKKVEAKVEAPKEEEVEVDMDMGDMFG